MSLRGRLGTLTALTALALPIASAPAAADGGALRVTEPRTEYRDDPLGIEAERPRLSWKLRSDRRDQVQSAYRVVVTRDGGDTVWDSGKVASRRNHLVEYGGPPLTGRTRYRWKAMVWDGAGRPGGWSEPAWWETGVLDDASFGADWIGAEVDTRLPTSQVEQSYPAELNDATLGQTITTDRPFTSAGVKTPTWNTSDSDASLTLRREGGEVVATKRFENVADNGWLDLTFDAQPPGVYELELHDEAGTVGWWSHGSDLYAHGSAQQGGEPVAGDRTFRWQPAEEEADGRTAQLRKEFRLGGRVARARLYASALGLYELNLNGRRVGDHRFAPGWTDYKQRVQYQTYDVTDLLRRDANAIAATISPGWYAGHVAIFGPNQYGTQPWLFAQLEVTYEDGRSETIVSDDSWRTATGPIVSSDILMGESYDARLETPGWDRPGYDDTSWTPARTKDDVAAELVAQEDQPVEITQTLEPRRITEPSAGTFVYDLGQNMVGSVRMRVRGERGTTVRLRHAEVLNADGSLYTDNLRSAKATDHYTLKGGGTETYEPEFTFHGFRYVEITGVDRAPDISGRVMHSDAPATGRLDTSSAMLDQLYSNITWGQRGNFLSIPTDTPARDERMGWSGDINVFVGAATYNMEVAPFLRKWLGDMRDAQFPNGAFPDVAPRVGFLGGGAAGWGDAGVTVPWTLWQQYGDTRVVREQYAAMERWIEYLQQHSNGLLRPAEGYGDWLNNNDETPKDVIATAYFAFSAAKVAEMATELGETADAERYRALAADVRAAFNRAYVSEQGRVKGDTQTAYVLALSFGLLPEEEREPAADRLVELIEARDWHLSTGFLGTPDLLEVLTDAGHLDVAYRLINQDTFPSWGYQVNQGATTMWEHWDSLRPDGSFEDPAMNSFNHYAYGAVGEWMFQTLAGIDNASPGFDEIRIRPQAGGGIDHADGRYESVHGPIESAWRDSERGFRLDVTIPVNTTAEVWVPAVDREAVDADGARFIRMEDGHAVYEIGSGEYRFESDDVRGHLRAAERLAEGRELERATAEARRAYERGGDRSAERELQDALEIAAEQGATDVHRRLSQASALLLNVGAAIGSRGEPIAAGDTVELNATVENRGRETLEDVAVQLDAPDGWTVEPQGPTGTDRLRPGATHTARFAVTVPLTQAVQDAVALTGSARFRRGGGVTEIPLVSAIDVVSPLTIAALSAEPRILDTPGATSTVTATVENRSSAPVTGALRAATPAGWTADPAEQPLELAPGERGDLTFRVASPPEQAAADVDVTLLYGANVGDTKRIRLTYALRSWLFETDGDAEDWHAVNHLAPFVVAGGVLSTSSTGGDPFMTQGERLALDGSDGLTVEVTMEVGADNGAQVFWTTAAEPGFSEGKSTKFPVTGGGMRTYEVPVPAFDGTLTGLRLDPQSGPGDIRIDSIRIVK
jgi:alpha-L-rhamnosidase